MTGFFTYGQSSYYYFIDIVSIKIVSLNIFSRTTQRSFKQTEMYLLMIKTTGTNHNHRISSV